MALSDPLPHRMNAFRLLPLLGCVLLVACQVEPPAVGSTAALEAQGVPVPASSAAQASRGAPAVPLEPAMPYARARVALLQAGWKPLDGHICTPSGQACARLPELESCSADDTCLMRFGKAGQILDVRTYGNLARWDGRDGVPPVTVHAWTSGSEH